MEFTTQEKLEIAILQSQGRLLIEIAQHCLNKNSKLDNEFNSQIITIKNDKILIDLLGEDLANKVINKCKVDGILKFKE